MTRQEKLSRICEINGFLSGLIIEGRTSGKPYRPSTGDEYQHLRDEVDQLRKEVFGDNPYPPDMRVKKDKTDELIEKLDEQGKKVDKFREDIIKNQKKLKSEFKKSRAKKKLTRMLKEGERK